jgi:hypothetical protein
MWREANGGSKCSCNAQTYEQIEKLFDVACTLTDVMACVPSADTGTGIDAGAAISTSPPYNTSTFEFGPRDYLHRILALVSTLRGGRSRFLPLLVAKVDGLMSTLATEPIIPHITLDDLDSAAPLSTLLSPPYLPSSSSSSTSSSSSSLAAIAAAAAAAGSAAGALQIPAVARPPADRVQGAADEASYYSDDLGYYYSPSSHLAVRPPPSLMTSASDLSEAEFMYSGASSHGDDTGAGDGGGDGAAAAAAAPDVFPGELLMQGVPAAGASSLVMLGGPPPHRQHHHYRHPTSVADADDVAVTAPLSNSPAAYPFHTTLPDGFY